MTPYIRSFAIAALAGLTACAHGEKTGAPAGPLWDDVVASCAKSDQCETDIFRRLSTLYRPSHEEGEVRAALGALTTLARAKVWDGSPEVVSETDAAGNLVIRLPATGKFKDGSADPFALQSHMDMVLAYRDARPGEDLRPRFRHGVEVVEKDGWLQSKDHLTTLGADDGSGMAVSLRYLLDPAREHPPLDLVFTVAEENGMDGVKGFALNLRGHRMVNLDSPDPMGGAVTIGSQGGLRLAFKGALAAEDVPKSATILALELSGLKGGHSGVDIHFDRVNATQGLGWILERFRRKHPRLWLLSASSGAALNQIPNSFVAKIAVDGVEDTGVAADELTKLASKLVAAHPDDLQSGFRWSAAREGNPGGLAGVGSGRLTRLLRAIAKAPNGVITRGGEEYPHAVLTSSNFANLGLRPAARAGDQWRAELELKTFSRSYAADELPKIGRRLGVALRGAWSIGDAVQESSAGYPPWMASEESPLLKLALAKSDYYHRTLLCPGGLETGYFSRRFPDLDLISLGANDREPHTVNERVETRSIRALADALARILASG